MRRSTSPLARPGRLPAPGLLAAAGWTRFDRRGFHRHRGHPGHRLQRQQHQPLPDLAQDHHIGDAHDLYSLTPWFKRRTAALRSNYRSVRFGRCGVESGLRVSGSARGLEQSQATYVAATQSTASLPPLHVSVASRSARTAPAFATTWTIFNIKGLGAGVRRVGAHRNGQLCRNGTLTVPAGRPRISMRCGLKPILRAIRSALKPCAASLARSAASDQVARPSSRLSRR